MANPKSALQSSPRRHHARQSALLLLATLCRASTLTSPAAALGRRAVYLTREVEKNGPLRAELETRGLLCGELPCIEHRLLAGNAQLSELLAQKQWQWVLVTSPEAGSLLVDAWEKAQRPALRVATVGPGTTKVLVPALLEVQFEPTKATGKMLAAELPASAVASDAPVLYPASARAPTTVQDGLGARGFSVHRVDTYTTESPEWTAEMQATAKAAEFAAFASPSALETWFEHAGNGATVICIGETSGARAKELGFERVHYPSKPGLKTWAALIEQVVNGEV
ncbi:tetrapyrrole biosynthesis, uroporphyrinogen III synthase [Pavlovales sp. CCMP2436]|nr:tetrapyrrole biosynthesis, uroporphyrinogen III synthase [Pavlovales sp. CCMP2436]